MNISTHGFPIHQIFILLTMGFLYLAVGILANYFIDDQGKFRKPPYPIKKGLVVGTILLAIVLVIEVFFL